MDQEINTELLNALEQIVKTVSDGKEIIIEQSPLVVQELILWQKITSLTYLFVFIVIFIISSFLSKKLFKESKKREVSDFYRSYISDENILSYVFLFFSIVSFLVVISNFCSVIQIWVAPRIFVIEYFSQLIK